MEEGGAESKATPTNRRALLVAYYWPPAGGPGVQRWLKFAKYLRHCGWDLTVIAPSGAAYPVLDPSLESDVPDDIEVHHVPIFEPYETAMKLMPSKSSERLGSGGGQESLSSRILRWLRGNVLLPDPRVLWRKRAVRAGKQRVRQAIEQGAPLEAIITTGPPHSVHLIGLDLKRATGLPWLADFRDLWREMDYLEDFLPTQRTRNRHESMERDVVKEADLITITSPSVRASLAIHLPEAALDKCHLIYNGWDEADVPAKLSEPKGSSSHNPGTFRLGHFGSLFPTRNAPGLWKAIRQWNANDSERPIHLDMVGKISPPVLDSMKAHLHTTDWTDHGYLPHQDAVRMMADMDALLLIQNDNTTGQRAIPGKAFEYLGMGKPIATMAPQPSDLHDLITEWGMSTCIHGDANAAMQMLQNLMSPSETPKELAQRYTRPTLSGEMAELLNGMVHPTAH